MSFLRRVLGLDSPASPDLPVRPDAPLPAVPIGETASVRRIATRLTEHPPAEARYIAAFAYLMGRAAHADLAFTDAEAREMGRLLVEEAGLEPDDAQLAIEIARLQSGEFGATEDYLVAREFKAISTEEQRLALIRCCLMVMAADDALGAEEVWLVNRIAEELDVPRPDLNRVRDEFHDRIAAVREVRRLARRSRGD
jgi:uncharacterized tellurite resistance protein B-like protein